MEPTFGVSFGLPGGAFGGGYPLNPLGTNPVVNPYGGAIGGDGVNFGSFNVNPLVSLQLGKGESGKKFRPLVNFHITPSAEKLAEKGLIGSGGVGGIGPGIGGFGGVGPGVGGLGGLGGFGGGGGFGGLPFRQLTKDEQPFGHQTDNSGLLSNNQSPLGSVNSYYSDFVKQGGSEEPFRFADTTNTGLSLNNQSPVVSNSNYYDDIVKQGGSEEPFRFASTSGNAIRPLRSARDGPYGEEAPLNLGEVGQGLQRVGLASDEASFKTHHYEKSFKKAFGKGYGYGVPYPVATPVAVPQPYGVPYAVPQPVPVAQPYAVPQPYPVKVPVVQHVPVQVPVQVPVRVEVPVHVPVRVEVPVPVAAPYPVPVPYEQPVQVHQHYHHQHPVPPPVPHYPPKASIYRPYPGAYGSPTYGYSGPVPSYSAPVASYGPTPYSNSGGKETPYAGQAQAHYSAEGNQPTAQVHTATGYDSITVQSAANDYTFRDSENNGQPKTRTSGVRFVDSRSGESDSSSSPAAFTSSSSSSSSAVKFEQAKRKRSADEQDFVETDASQPQPETNEVRWLVPFCLSSKETYNCLPTVALVLENGNKAIRLRGLSVKIMVFIKIMRSHPIQKLVVGGNTFIFVL